MERCAPKCSLCDWSGMMMTKKKKEKTRIEEKIKKIVKKYNPNQPRFLVTTTLTPQPPKSSIKQSSKRSSVTHEKEEPKCHTLTTLLEHENQDTLEDID